MTWAIGACNQLGGYAALFSDVQVTFGDGRPANLLRKAYPVGPDLIGAFAGSVYIGFRLLQSVVDFLRVDDPESAWEPAGAAQEWAPIARNIFNDSPEVQRRLGAQFLLVGTHPKEDGIPGRAIPYLAKFSAPDFALRVTRNSDSAIDIGCGAAIPHYKAHIRSILDPRSGFLNAEVGQLGGWAQAMGHSLSLMLERHPIAGISHHVHIHVAARGGYALATSNRREIPRDGPARAVQMPPVAESYEELVKMAQEIDAAAATAMC